MMGRQSADQRRFFYDFCLEDYVPADHLLRRHDGLLDLSAVRQQLKPHYSHMGRPSVDPELMIRMLIVGYCFGIRSERRLCDEVHLNLAYRWFCRLGLEDSVPDHSTFSLNRHGRFRDSDAFRLVFEAVLQRCMAAGLVGGEGFAIDAFVLEADASRHHGVAPDEIDLRRIENPSRAIRDYIAALDEAGALEPGRKPPKVISPSDPASAWTAKANKHQKNSQKRKTAPASHRGGNKMSAVTNSGHLKPSTIRLYQQYRSIAALTRLASRVCFSADTVAKLFWGCREKTFIHIADFGRNNES